MKKMDHIHKLSRRKVLEISNKIKFKLNLLKTCPESILDAGV